MFNIIFTFVVVVFLVVGILERFFGSGFGFCPDSDKETPIRNAGKNVPVLDCASQVKMLI